MTATCTCIEKFHITILVESEFQSLRGVVDFSRDDRIGEFDVVGKLLIHIE